MRTGVLGLKPLLATAFVAFWQPAMVAAQSDAVAALDAVSAEEAAVVEDVIVLSDLQVAVQSALEGAAPELVSFYEARDFEPVWTEDRLAGLIAIMSTALEHAVPVPSEAIRALNAQTAVTPADVARQELAATHAYLDFARDLNSGVLTPSRIDREMLIKPKVGTADALMNRVTLSSDMVAVLRGLVPSHPGYARLLDERLRLEAIIAGRGWGESVPANKVLRPGRSYPAVPLLRARLDRMGYGDLGDAALYDDELMMVIKLFQARHGLNADGVAGPATLAAVNATPEERLGQVFVNLERHRWLNYPRGARHIHVNMADYTMKVIDNGVPSFTSRVVIGRSKEDFRTPEFTHEMTHMVVNPFWHVPRSIAGREYLPLLKQDPMAMANRGFLVMNRRGQVLNTEGASFAGYSEDNFPFLIKQPPGRRNALGRVKFMFPNRHNIYLHDTPAKKLFAKDRRAYSHGCVRVQRPFDLAYHLLDPQMKNPVGTFQSYLKRGRERYVNLKTPVPIYLSYETAWVTDDGVPQYRGDVYGRDRKVLRALKGAGLSLTHLDG